MMGMVSLILFIRNMIKTSSSARNGTEALIGVLEDQFFLQGLEVWPQPAGAFEQNNFNRKQQLVFYFLSFKDFTNRYLKLTRAPRLHL